MNRLKTSLEHTKKALEKLRESHRAFFSRFEICALDLLEDFCVNVVRSYVFINTFPIVLIINLDSLVIIMPGNISLFLLVASLMSSSSFGPLLYCHEPLHDQRLL